MTVIPPAHIPALVALQPAQLQTFEGVTLKLVDKSRILRSNAALQCGQYPLKFVESVVKISGASPGSDTHPTTFYLVALAHTLTGSHKGPLWIETMREARTEQENGW